MEEKYEQIQRFLHVCDDLVGGTFHDADAEISEALRAIADCKELTNLFGAVTSGYDFPAAKRACLEYSPASGNARGVAYLPSARNEVLAFVFCLFVEFDGGAMRLNDFLLRYFYVDGSYTASYSLFADRMIRPFRDIVRDCYPDCGKRGEYARAEQRRDETLGKIAAKLTEERGRVLHLPLREEEKQDAEKLFPALIAAAGRRDVDGLIALLAGYRYFLKYLNDKSAASDTVFALAAELER